MNKTLLFLLSISVITSSVLAKTNEDILLNAFHENGITKCDKFIKKNSKLFANFNVFIDKHDDGIDGASTEVSLVTIVEQDGENIKFDDSFIQTKKNCVLHSKSIVTKLGSCNSNINLKNWKITSPMPKKDYTAFENQFGVLMYTKEIKVGESKVCIVETSLRKKEYEKGKEKRR